MNRELVAEVASRARRVDRVHIVQNVGDGDVWSGQLLHKAVIALEPSDRRRVALVRQQFAAAPANWGQGMIVYLTSGDVGNLRGKEIHQAAQDAAFGLTAQAEKNKILPRQKRVRDMT